MRVLVTGGAGYIGSHACKRLLDAGHSVVVIDNLVRGHREAIGALQRIGDRLEFHQGEVGDEALLSKVLIPGTVDAVLHFAALAYVRESMEQPLEYYRANTAPAPALIDAAHRCGVRKFVFSSTCATYGSPPPTLIPIREDCPQRPINPYGWSKLFVERMLLDYAGARAPHGDAMGVGMLRYFNVAGCDRSGTLGEDHRPETHIIPLLIQTALGRSESFAILGDDHDTPDGTCVRDFIHVEDLVDAHLATLQALRPGEVRAYNLGIGRGFSVREVIGAVERIAGVSLRTTIGPSHPGDPPTLFCDPSRIERELGWRASVRDLDQIIASAWTWFRDHPGGYGEAR
jgi:UDP-glucose-4-epimerase GalE